jgi:hypothetical protein
MRTYYLASIATSAEFSNVANSGRVTPVYSVLDAGSDSLRDLYGQVSRAVVGRAVARLPSFRAKVAATIQETARRKLTVVGFVERLHNPAGRRCGCPPECICQRSALGRTFRWYIPGRFHAPIPPEQKAQLEAEGRSFREA